jgi:monothiol glutaredoxin
MFSRSIIIRGARSLASQQHKIPEKFNPLSAVSTNLTAPQSLFNTTTTTRHFSHDDFAPQKKHNLENSNDSEILSLIDSHVKSNRIMLYMKGSPSQPMCGFSANIVQILKNQGVDFASVNVLDYPEVREGVKKYAQWPTIPQLYVDGEFVGGLDIVKDLEDSGELSEMLKVEKKD